MLELKELNTNGKISVSVLVFFELIFACVATYTPWWQLWFTDCVGSDQYYWIVFDDGLCETSSSSDAPSDGTCGQWNDYSDAGGDMGDAADDFISSRKLMVTIITFTTILLLASATNFFIPKAFDKISRMAQAAFYLLSCLFVIVIFGITNNNWFYDADNYSASIACSSQLTALDGGYACGILLLFFLAGSSALVVGACGKNCCGCQCIVEDEETARLTANPAVATATVVDEKGQPVAATGTVPNV